MESFTTTVALIGIVILVASLLSGVLEKSGLPIVAVFLALGAVLGPYGLGFVDIGFDSPALHAIAMLALALVLFSDAVTIDVTEVKTRKPLLWRLLGPGTLAPAAIVTVSARFLLGISWPASAILGAALASTDPVLLRSVLRFRAFPVVPRIALRIETGMNDVVLLPIVVLSIIAVGGSVASAPGPGSAVARSIVGLFLLGPALGALVGWLGIILLEQIRNRFTVRRDYESLYAIGLALSSFALAESVGGSGFLAAFAAGLMVSWQDVELCDCFLEYGEATAEMLLLLTFVALGTSLIWTGLTVIDFPTVVFAAIALIARTIVLYPVLTRAHVTGRDRKLVAFFGPRGLSSLLLVLLPVFAGITGAERLFSIASLVVLSSVVLHGSGIAYFLRRNAISSPAEPRAALPLKEENIPADVPDRITIEEVRRLQAAGEDVIILDARADRNRRNSETQAAGSVRVDPHQPVQDAKALKLSQQATLVVYCA
ncbi:MAG TPA: cation:proton antiporter [Gemmatimonadaceae bacterium]|nr:cation:proton antiporter [Gemmatimonadaceae bacterium]